MQGIKWDLIIMFALTTLALIVPFLKSFRETKVEWIAFLGITVLIVFFATLILPFLFWAFNYQWNNIIVNKIFAFASFIGRWVIGFGKDLVLGGLRTVCLFILLITGISAGWAGIIIVVAVLGLLYYLSINNYINTDILIFAFSLYAFTSLWVSTLSDYRKKEKLVEPFTLLFLVAFLFSIPIYAILIDNDKRLEQTNEITINEIQNAAICKGSQVSWNGNGDYYEVYIDEKVIAITMDTFYKFGNIPNIQSEKFHDISIMSYVFATDRSLSKPKNVYYFGDLKNKIVIELSENRNKAYLKFNSSNADTNNSVQELEKVVWYLDNIEITTGMVCNIPNDSIGKLLYCVIYLDGCSIISKKVTV